MPALDFGNPIALPGDPTDDSHATRRKSPSIRFNRIIVGSEYHFHERRIDLFGFFVDKGFVEFSVKISLEYQSPVSENRADQTILAVFDATMTK